jgi:hypothetical protein
MNRFASLLARCAACYAFVAADAAPTPEAVVQAQLEAYNARDIDAFVATYTADVQLFELPDKVLVRGAEQLRERYKERFADERLHATIVNRIVMGNTVVDHERVRLTLPDGPGTLEAIAIYEVRDGKIATVWFRLGDRKPDSAPVNP